MLVPNSPCLRIRSGSTNPTVPHQPTHMNVTKLLANLHFAMQRYERLIHHLEQASAIYFRNNQVEKGEDLRQKSQMAQKYFVRIHKLIWRMKKHYSGSNAPFTQLYDDAGYSDYGWEHQWPTVPQRVRRCRELEHIPTYTRLPASNDQMVVCPFCQIYYNTLGQI